MFSPRQNQPILRDQDHEMSGQIFALTHNGFFSMLNRFLILVLLIAILSSCAPASQPQAPSAKATNPLSEVTYQPVTTSPLPTRQAPTATETHTVTPRPTATSTLTPFPPSATATFTLAPLPTLGQADRDQALKEYMKTNGNCPLPCFWGFNSGEISWKDMRDFLEHLDLKITGGPFHLDETAGSYNADFTLMKNVEFRGGVKVFIREDQTVQLISFGANDLRQAPYYSFRNIMKDLGVPAYMGVDLSLGREGPPALPGSSSFPDPASITIMIAYEENDQKPWLEKPWALFYYSGAAYNEGTRYRFCPTDLGTADPAWPPDHFSLSLQSPHAALTVDELAALYGRRYLSEPPDIESATSVSVQEVYNRIMENQGRVCFYTPIDFWPY